MPPKSQTQPQTQTQSQSQPQLLMHRYDDRLSTFASISKPKSRARQGWPLSESTHPLLTPEDMAFAGFYYSPGGSSAGTDDTCVCFLCGLSLGGWDEEDDPCMEHVKRGDCAWADSVCQVEVDLREGKEPTYTTQNQLPSSSTSSRVRENTFYSKDREVSWWPHQKSGFIPNPSTLANAGFVFCPTADEPDLVRCPLCKYEVEGWEAQDDPLEIHRHRYPDCLFFTAQVHKGKRTKQKKQAEVEVESPTITNSKKGHSRTNSRSQPIAAPAAAAAAAGGSRTRQQTSEAPSEAPKMGRSTRSRPKRGQKEGDVETIDLVEEEDEHEPEHQAEGEGDDSEMEEAETAKGRRKTRGVKGEKSKSNSATTTRKGGTSQDVPETDTDLVTGAEDDANGPSEVELESITKGSKKGSKSKSSRKTIKATPADAVVDTIEEPQLEPEVLVDVDQEDPSERVKKSTKSKSTKSTKSKSTKSRSKTKTKSESEVEENQANTEPETGAELNEGGEGEGQQEVAVSKSKARKPRTTTRDKKAIDTDPEMDQVDQEPSQSRLVSQKVGSGSRSKAIMNDSGALMGGGKPLPALPASTHSRTQSQSKAPVPSRTRETGPAESQDRPLSQLERFTNIPPSSPASAPAMQTQTQTAGRVTKSIPKKGNSQPARAAVPKSKLNSRTSTIARAGHAVPLEVGAKAARSVIDQALDALSPTSLTAHVSPQPVPTQAQTQTQTQIKSSVSTSTQKVPGEINLAEGIEMEMAMTLEQWIRSQMGHKRSEIEQQGIERIKEFERRTVEARKRIESLPTR